MEQLDFGNEWTTPDEYDPRLDTYAFQKRASYQRTRERDWRKEMKRSRAGRDIGDLPEVKDPERKAKAREDFRFFCETYFPETFKLAWSEDHLRAIAKIEQAVLNGGLFALAMSRGSGKSSLVERAAIWAMLYGHREFILLIGASETAALEMLNSIKTEIESNEHLAEDFPEVAVPIQRIAGVLARCAGQLCNGERTRITWTNNELVLPTIKGAASSGIIVRVAGITGRIRGMKHMKPNGKTVRPEFVVIDDPQTSESAESVEQTRKRVRILTGDILGLAGPGKKISSIMPCTVIRPGDMAEQILDRTQHPEWNGERCKMMYAMPRNEELWSRYAEIRAEELRESGTFAKATEFYVEHRSEMDEGAKPAWPERHNPDEVSAVQHAMNLKLTDEAAFQAEYQNEPLLTDMGAEEQLTIDVIINKLNGLVRATVPSAARHITMFVDVQKNLLFFVICAWDEDFTGYVIDYGAWPEQKRLRFDLKDANPTLQMKFPYAGLEESLEDGLKAVTDDYLARTFRREDGVPMRIERCLVDANWGISTDIVDRVCRTSSHSQVLMPSHGKYYGAGSTPMGEWKRGPGDLVGLNWRVPSNRGKRLARYVLFDTNYWKSFVASRILTMLGSRGCLSLWGSDPERHRLFAEHLTAEYRTKVDGCGRSVDEWKLRPEAKDNHWFDGLVGCAVGASMMGCSLGGPRGEVMTPKRREPLDLSKFKRQMYKPNRR